MSIKKADIDENSVNPELLDSKEKKEENASNIKTTSEDGKFYRIHKKDSPIVKITFNCPKKLNEVLDEKVDKGTFLSKTDAIITALRSFYSVDTKNQ